MISTTSITGERSSWRGSSLTKACFKAGFHSAAKLVLTWFLGVLAPCCAFTGAFIMVLR